MQAGLWAGAGGAVAVAIAAGLADRIRERRRNLDHVGWMPWQLISILALFTTVGLAAAALQS